MIEGKGKMQKILCDGCKSDITDVLHVKIHVREYSQTLPIASPALTRVYDVCETCKAGVVRTFGEGREVFPPGTPAMRGTSR